MASFLPDQSSNSPPVSNQRSRKSDKFQKELRKKYDKQHTRKVKSAPALDETTGIPLDDFASFSEHLKNAKRILALFGAGLSAASGIPTFRGAGGFWREHDAIELASPEAFENDPGLVWQFYSYRRHQALQAQPNRAHAAFARLAKANPDRFLAISQNIDGLSTRAGHTWPQMESIHGSLFSVQCSDRTGCGYEEINFEDPISPALTIPDDYDIADVKFPIKELAKSDLPHCPKCKTNLLRPGVVWFGEPVSREVVDRINEWVSRDKIDLMLVVGTTALVFPAAGYIYRAKQQGARVAIVNMERANEDDEPNEGLREEDWFFHGDAAVLVPEMLKAVIGKTA